jgi:hypothetical protein
MSGSLLRLPERAIGSGEGRASLPKDWVNEQVRETFRSRPRRLESDPDAATPIAGAFMLTPTMMFSIVGLSPLPPVRIDLEMEFGTVTVPPLRVQSPSSLQMTAADALAAVEAMRRRAARALLANGHRFAVRLQTRTIRIRCRKKIATSVEPNARTLGSSSSRSRFRHHHGNDAKPGRRDHRQSEEGRCAPGVIEDVSGEGRADRGADAHGAPN